MNEDFNSRWAEQGKAGNVAEMKIDFLANDKSETNLEIKCSTKTIWLYIDQAEEYK